MPRSVTVRGEEQISTARLPNLGGGASRQADQPRHDRVHGRIQGPAIAERLARSRLGSETTATFGGDLAPLAGDEYLPEADRRMRDRRSEDDEDTRLSGIRLSPIRLSGAPGTKAFPCPLQAEANRGHQRVWYLGA